jgi:hypothetical protein
MRLPQGQPYAFPTELKPFAQPYEPRSEGPGPSDARKAVDHAPSHERSRASDGVLAIHLGRRGNAVDCRAMPPARSFATALALGAALALAAVAACTAVDPNPPNPHNKPTQDPLSDPPDGSADAADAEGGP